jgi:hypothetical protein
MGNLSADGSSNKWNEWENIKRQIDNLCFLAGWVDTKRYGKLKTELNNASVSGQNNYPKMVESAVTMMSHHMNNKGVHMADDNKGQTMALKSLCRNIRTWRATDAARRATTQTSVLMVTAMMSHQLDQV